MRDGDPIPLGYESARISKARRRWFIVSRKEWAVIQFALWLIGMIAAGLGLLVFFSMFR